MSMVKTLEVILAATPAGEIGYQNTIPWRLKGDLSRFKSLTMGCAVIMGRKTFESLPSPLTGRTVIVVSTTLPATGTKELETIDPEKTVYHVKSFEQALTLADVILPNKRVMVAGGVSLYQAAMKLPCIVHLTTVYQKAPNGYDAVIPDFNFKGFLSDSSIGSGEPEVVFMNDFETEQRLVSHTYATYYTNGVNPNIE